MSKIHKYYSLLLIVCGNFCTHCSTLPFQDKENVSDSKNKGARVRRLKKLSEEEKKEKQMVIFEAIQNGETKTVEDLFKMYPDDLSVDYTSEENWTALHEAADYNSLSLVKMLYLRGADINKKDGLGRTPLMWAVSRINERGKTFLDMVIMTGWLMAHGADSTVMDNEGKSLYDHIDNKSFLKEEKWLLKERVRYVVLEKWKASEMESIGKRIL